MLCEDVVEKNFLQRMSEYLPDMLWAKDLEGHYLFANRAICENLLMADMSEVLGKTDIFFALRERGKYPQNPKWHTFGELCFNSDEIVLKELKPMRFEEYGNIRGKLTYLEVHKAPFYNEKGELIGTIGSGRDITTQKMAQETVDTINNLANSGPVVLFEWFADEGWSIKSVSKNVKELLGFTQEEIVASHMPFVQFVHPEDLESLVLEVGRYISTQTASFSQNYRILNRNHKSIWVSDFTAIEYGDEGSVKSIKGYLIDNTAQVKAHEEIRKLNSTDILTALPNRQKIQNDLKNNHPKACIVFNIDRFREINDLFGVKAGDSILKQVALWFEQSNIDIYRIGGDEFATLLYEEKSKLEIENFIKEILEQFSNSSFFVENQAIPVHINIGAAMGNHKLLTQADIALHEAKEKRYQYAFYEEKANIEEIYRSNITIAANIHSAILQNRIICHYQPIVDFKSKKIVKYEALVRLIDEEGSVISPIHFLHIAKKTKLYAKITQIVINHACETFKDRDEEFSVNISIDDIQNPKTVQEIVSTIIRTGTASRIVFEILESEGIENYNTVEQFIKQVKLLGAKIAIDDFGSGYSNFEHILRLDIDYIKIDGTLIKDILTNKNNDIIVETIVDFTSKIGAKTIAEFVSDEKIFDMLKKMGVDFCQGYFTGKPNPI